MLSLAQQITLACLWEVSAPKVGNVHRGADFEDLSFYDFLVSAVAVGPIVAEARQRGVGRVVLEAVRATRALTATNTNLGVLLLLAPLAAVPPERELAEGIGDVLQGLGPQDAESIYQAIREAQPGGLGEVDQWDVRAAPPADLLEAMRLAAERDLIARQFTNQFHEVLRLALPWLLEARAHAPLPRAIVDTHLRLLAALPDSLIARKCGPAMARQASDRAAAILDAGSPGHPDYLAAVADFDFWLRSDGHRRNPGATADLIAAAVFAGMRGGRDGELWKSGKVRAEE